MIGLLRGILAEKSVPGVLLDVQGVGYEVEVPTSTFYVLPETGEEVVLYTHLIVREDAQLLYGFASQSERILFRSLIKVNGVGAKLAVGILSGISAEDFIRCVEYEDTARLVSLPGIGKKTAERLIIEMRDRLPQMAANGGANGVASSTATLGSPVNAVGDAVSALVALGYSHAEAGRLVKGVDHVSLASDEIIRQALQAAGSR